jgi:tetratricopeptide (TPR) repeat protein
MRLAPVYYACGDYAQAIDLFTWNITALEGRWVHERFGLPVLPAVLTRQFLVWCLAERGAFAEALRRGAEAVQIAEAVDHPLSLVVAYYTVGLPHVWRGDFEKGISLMERSLEILPLSQMALPFFYLAPILGHAYARCGRLAEAVPLLEQAMEAIAKRFVTNYSVGARYLSEAYLLARREREARDWADRARAFAQDHRQRVDEAGAFWLLGEIAARADPPEVEQAERHYHHALTLADDLGMRPLVAHCHLGLGTLYARITRHEEAHAELTTAAEMYRAMEMPFWLARAEAERR